MFSICIPNYNYEQYLGSTLQSIANQKFSNYEVVVADNQSTDGSIAILEQYQSRIRNLSFKVNSTNLGFAGNLDEVGSMAERDYMIMLSSDDKMFPNALEFYSKLIMALPETDLIITASKEVIDDRDNLIRTEYAVDMHKSVWSKDYLDPMLTQVIGCSVFKIDSKEILRKCIEGSINPFNFLASCYPRKVYEKIGGYGNSRLINPDKWFHWKILMEVQYAVYIDRPLFQYRWHQNNQTAQEKNSGHLKYLSDEYRTSIELNREMLDYCGLAMNDGQEAFIHNTIILHGLSELSKGLWTKSLRIFLFGWATYPGLMMRNSKVLAYLILLAFGPIGILVAKQVKQRIY